MTEKVKTVDLSLQQRAATIRASTFDEAERTVEVVWTTGADVTRYSWWDDEYYIERLIVTDEAVDMARLSGGAAPVLDSHQARSLANQIGVVERAWIDNGVGHALIRLSSRPELAGIVADIQSGVLRNISVGYSVERFEITREQGQLPVYAAARWQPQELSFVPIPADHGATTRAADTAERGKAPCHLITREAPTMADTTIETPTAPAADQPEQQRSAPAPAAPAVEQPSAADLAARSADIVALATRHGFADKAADWLRSGKTIDQVRAEILDAREKRDAESGGSFNRVSAGADENDRKRAAAVEVILHRGRVQGDDRKVVQIARENPFRSYTLLEMARNSLDRAGVRTDGLSKMELVGRAFTQSSSDFPILLEDAMHKALQSAYAVAADTWSRFCARGTVSDFREHKRYRVGSLGNLDALTELNEFRNKAIPDGERSKIQAGTKGNIINLSRQAIINDDLSAFVGLATAFARAAGRTVEADVYALLASNPTLDDGIALFHASHGNLASSAGVTVDSVDAARVLMAKQMDVGGNDFLDIRPSIWVGGLALGGTARVVNGAEYDPDATNKLQRPNKVRGLFADIVDTPRIATADWYVFADPGEAPVIEVAFLDGQDAPYLEMEEGFSTDGARWKVRLDYGVAAIDYRGAVKTPA